MFTPNQLRKALRDYNKFDNGVNLGRFRLPGCESSMSLSDDCGETGSVTVTFMAMDECGNASESTAVHHRRHHQPRVDNPSRLHC